MRSPPRLWSLAYRRSRALQTFLYVRWAQAATPGDRRAPSVPGGLVPAFRSDGVGIQAFSRLAVRQMARRHGVPYLHVPFLKLAHQDVDPIGRTLSEPAWAARWESALGIGVGEPSLAGLADALGPVRTARRLYAGLRHGNAPPATSSELRAIGLEVMRQADRFEADLDAEAVAEVRGRYAASRFAPTRPAFSEEATHVAIHVRRGDVWAMAPDHAWGGYRVRFLSEAYYIDLIGRLADAWSGASRPVRFHVFSDGGPEDFPGFEFRSPVEADLRLASGQTVRRIAFHLRSDTFDALHHLAHASVLVPAKSAFSALAVLVGSARVLYDPQIFEMGAFSPLAGYLREDGRARPLTELAELTREMGIRA